MLHFLLNYRDTDEIDWGPSCSKCGPLVTESEAGAWNMNEETGEELETLHFV